MINRIISFSIENKLIIALFTITLIVLGIWSMTKIPLDAVPDITNNQVQVITQAPNLGTEDIEQFITYTVELAMANLPGVIEIRSVSRFGLSVVTIVFEDDMGTYLPRQLVSEKLNVVKKEIPIGFGEPEMGPISTGLGEIYQYSLNVDPAFKNNYSLTDLRTMQDWIVRRQMAMVPGVVEVNAFGGDVKQYEVAVDPDELKAIGLTITDIFSALEKNNQNTGGAYIEKNHYANFIRGEGLARNITDIENIVVTNLDGIPITIKDVAKVQYGKAVKYGAFTKDGEGEAVGGMILMLKGANSNTVIKAVKKRIIEIQKSLPEGVKIEPFLDRSKLIAKTTSTVRKNLLEGALIVIFVLVFLLGNWRGGLIVASTIPLSLLFAFILMNVFGVWANLMSLGAIDFGIIIDGAVIIVEGTVFILHDKVLKKQNLNSESRDKVAYEASSKMMNSAFFGQLIILIVFIPILALQGVEGKMFRPMALTFMFAMIGVMILCLTYVPMMSAWFLRAEKDNKSSWGDRLIIRLQNFYEPLLTKALKRSALIIGGAVTLSAIALFSFSRMGGEFIPQLDEGDIAFHAILKPGSSLSETIATTTKVEQIVLDNFPEVKHVMSRIGVADVPTDPMPMDIADIFVILKPIEEWVSAESKEELIDKMKRSVEQVPGVNFEFTQPIEMRFNELITGVREDISIKLFGEDLDVLAKKGEEIGRIVANIEGVADMKVEAINGLPQMTIKYDRHKLAQYGLNIEELNASVQSAFAGGKAGVIFEGEKRFDLVVRLDEKRRKSIDDIKNLYINLPNATQIPLKEVANINYQTGPMQISRDNTNRRTYVGINVRGRDVKSLVEEIQQKIESELVLAPGYYIRYGGAFENLERASNRLKLVIPVVLVLIFLLIFFALKSIKQSMMIFIAIPLSAIGGVFALGLRDMPFSISAGVGFIVLFGVAVLNGLVLISSWNELKESGHKDLDERIKLGTRRRMRPILLTALTDILGFLPMAISTSAGAEVQQPLATVVIGGMISATLLTLFVLPILYKYMEGNKKTTIRPSVKFATISLIGIFMISNCDLSAQENESKVLTSLDEVIALGLENNGNVIASRTNIQLEEQGKKSAIDLGKTDVLVQFGQFNSFENDVSINVNQKIEFPTAYSKKKKLASQKVTSSRLQLTITENQLKRNIRSAWFHLAYLSEMKSLILYQDTLYEKYYSAAVIRYETEETSFLEMTSAESKRMNIQNELHIINADIEIQEEELRILVNDTNELSFRPTALPELNMIIANDLYRLNANPLLLFARQEIEIAKAEREVQSSKLLPDITLGYYNQTFNGLALEDNSISNSSNRFSSFMAGVSVPIFYGSYKADVNSAKLKMQIAETNAAYYSKVLEGQYYQYQQELIKLYGSLNYYKENVIPQSNLIIKSAQESYRSGSISYIELFLYLSQGIRSKFEFIETLNSYNQAVISLEYLHGQ